MRRPDMANEWIQSIRVDDPNCWQVSMLGLDGFRIIDVTYDPHQRNWVITFAQVLG